jgi:hypothetical protein
MVNTAMLLVRPDGHLACATDETDTVGKGRVCAPLSSRGRVRTTRQDPAEGPQHTANADQRGLELSRQLVTACESAD